MTDYKIAVEDVGTAEQVLQRLLHERKTLENVGVVLKTYREAVADLQNVQQETATARVMLEQIKEEAVKAEAQHRTRIQQAKADAKWTIDNSKANLEADLFNQRKTLDFVVDQVKVEEEKLLAVIAKHKDVMVACSSEIESQEARLTALKTQQEAVVGMLQKIQAVIK